MAFGGVWCPCGGQEDLDVAPSSDRLQWGTSCLPLRHGGLDRLLAEPQVWEGRSMRIRASVGKGKWRAGAGLHLVVERSPRGKGLDQDLHWARETLLHPKVPELLVRPAPWGKENGLRERSKKQTKGENVVSVFLLGFSGHAARTT